MTSIDFITLDVSDPTAASQFYADLLGLEKYVRVRGSDAPTSGFRGFTLSLVVPRPADVDAFVDAAAAAGATILKPAEKSMWGYGGTVQAPDGTIITMASSSKKDDGPATKQIDDVVLQLGVDDVRASKEFYAERGFTVAKSFGRKYVEFDTGRITVTLNKRQGLAKVVGVSPVGSGSHRLAVTSDAGGFTDPDGFTWESTI